MSYAEERNPAKHVVSIAAVVVLHIIIIWALMTGLARKVVQAIKAPIETKIIEEVKPPPPPEKIELPPPPKFTPPPPAYVPPPEVQIQTPPPPAPTITTTPEPPPVQAPVQAPRVEAPPAPPAPAPAPTPAPPAPVTVTAVCPGYDKIIRDAGYPPEAQRAGVERGEVELMLTIAASGEVKQVDVVRSTHRSFNRYAVATARQIQCQPQPRDVQVKLPLGYKLE